MSKNIVFEGWLTKSPPTKRIWRTKWRRRWFALRQSGELPGQYFLDYYADRNCRRLKGTINLDLCEQVDAGLHMERSNNGTLDPKHRGSVFTIQTQSRTYHLEADCEADMAKWVDAICRVCGLQSKDNSSEAHQGNYEMSTMNERYEAVENTDPYIPISECITGVRSQNSHRAFSFDSKNIVISTRKPVERVSNRNHQMYKSQPHIRPHNPELSENDSNMSEEESKSLNASQSNIREWAAAKSYTKSTVGTSKNEGYQPGPPVPPRPPKTFAMSKEAALKNAQTPRVHDPIDAPNRTIPYQQRMGVICQQPRRRLEEPNSSLRVPSRHPATGPPSPSRHQIPKIIVKGDDDEESSGQSSMQYCNVLVIPPAVDRNLKPRHSSHSLGHAQNLGIQFQTVAQINRNESRTVRSEVLQYLDLDLGPSKPTETKDINGKTIEMIHGRTAAALEARSVYKTVDFLKTEAFNITRQDAEASRNIHH